MTLDKNGKKIKVGDKVIVPDGKVERVVRVKNDVVTTIHYGRGTMNPFYKKEQHYSEEVTKISK